MLLAFSWQWVWCLWALWVVQAVGITEITAIFSRNSTSALQWSVKCRWLVAWDVIRLFLSPRKVKASLLWLFPLLFNIEKQSVLAWKSVLICLRGNQSFLNEVRCSKTVMSLYNGVVSWFGFPSSQTDADNLLPLSNIHTKPVITDTKTLHGSTIRLNK